MSEAVKSLEDQLQDQKQQLEENIRQTEAQMSRLKEQYLKDNPDVVTRDNYKEKNGK